ncbi:MAG: alanine racemase [Proteobacteria bacterium]|nr:alanine racemase [Pseudomonadota bacterium]
MTVATPHTPAAPFYVDESCSWHGQELFVEQCGAAALAQHFGTPLYVLSESRLRANCRELRLGVQRYWGGPVQLLPSLKANPIAAVRRVLNEEQVGCDVFGSHELQAALRAGVAPRTISVNGTAKGRALIEQAIACDATLTLDSAEEVQILLEVAQAHGCRPRAHLRLRPDFTDLTEPSDFFPDGSIAQAAQRYRPGIEPAAARTLGAAMLDSGRVQLTGLMAHLGRHSADLGVWHKMALGFGATVVELCRNWSPWVPAELDVGGGWPCRRDPTSPARRPAHPIERYAEAVAVSLTAVLGEGGLSPQRIALQVEPGRSLYADAGVHLSRVLHVKRQERPVPRTWVQLDTSEMFLPDLLIEHAAFAPVFATRGAQPCRQVVDLVGASCGFDLLALDVPAPPLQSGDVIAFLDTGAYQDAVASNFNLLGRPGTVLVSGSQARWIKRPENLDDVLAREVPDAAPVCIGTALDSTDNGNLTS